MRVGKIKYVIPIMTIKESLKPDTDIISNMMDGQEVVNIRDELIPVLRLHEFFNIIPPSQKLYAAIGI